MTTTFLGLKYKQTLDLWKFSVYFYLKYKLF